MKVGDRVRVIKGPWASDCGEIKKMTKVYLKVKLDTRLDGLAIVHPDDVEVEVEGPAEATDEESPFDFDSGLGIGGLAFYEEPPFVPSIKQLEKLEQMEAQAIYCRKCGQSDVFDGAMFTTGGGDVCDDCF